MRLDPGQITHVEAASRLAVSKNTIANMLDDGRLRRLGNRVEEDSVVELENRLFGPVVYCQRCGAATTRVEAARRHHNHDKCHCGGLLRGRAVR